MVKFFYTNYNFLIASSIWYKAHFLGLSISLLKTQKKLAWLTVGKFCNRIYMVDKIEKSL